MWKLFCETGNVESRQGQRGAPPANQVLDEAAMWALLHELLDNPEYTLKEHHEAFGAETDRIVDISTFCRAVWRLGFTRQKLQQYAHSRDERWPPRARLTAPRAQIQGYCSA